MENRSAIITVNPKLAKAYNAAPKKVQRKAQSVLQQLLREASVPATEAARLSKAETALFLKINRAFPAPQLQQYKALKGKQDAETLTADEHAELLQLVEAHQQLWAERLEAVLKLARLRHVTPAALFQQLGIDPSKYA